MIIHGANSVVDIALGQAQKAYASQIVNFHYLCTLVNLTVGLRGRGTTPGTSKSGANQFYCNSTLPAVTDLWQPVCVLKKFVVR